MITEKEITKGKKVPDEYKADLATLLERISKLRDLWGKPLTVTSGYRSMEEHLKIYEKKGITDKSKIPMKSKHLFCQACDFHDPDGSLKEFVKENNYKILIDCKLWMEAEEDTPNWLHVQILAPKSGKREFKP